MDINERYKTVVKEVDEYFKTTDYVVKNKLSYKKTIDEIDEFLSC